MVIFRSKLLNSQRLPHYPSISPGPWALRPATARRSTFQQPRTAGRGARGAACGAACGAARGPCGRGTCGTCRGGTGACQAHMLSSHFWAHGEWIPDFRANDIYIYNIHTHIHIHIKINVYLFFHDMRPAVTGRKYRKRTMAMKSMACWNAVRCSDRPQAQAPPVQCQVG